MQGQTTTLKHIIITNLARFSVVRPDYGVEQMSKFESRLGNQTLSYPTSLFVSQLTRAEPESPCPPLPPLHQYNPIRGCKILDFFLHMPIPSYVSLILPSASHHDSALFHVHQLAIPCPCTLGCHFSHVEQQGLGILYYYHHSQSGHEHKREFDGVFSSTVERIDTLLVFG